MQKIAFFDIDGTLTSEVDGSVPDSAVIAIRRARANGHLMFINTGRCFQNIEQRFQSIGFDGYVAGCGTNIYYQEKELLHEGQTHEVTLEIVEIARKLDVDVVFESREEVVFDRSRELFSPNAKRLYYSFCDKHYDMSHEVTAEDFTCDKFVAWFRDDNQMEKFREVSDKYFDCIDRGVLFREFVPRGYSKATGIQFLLEHFHLPLEQAYAFGDSNNDLPMLNFVPHSVVMGNAEDKKLLEIADYVTDKASQNGIAKALEKLGFLD